MARGRMMRPAATFLLFLNFCMYAVVLGICGWAMNRIVNYGSVGGGQNAATPFFIMFSLIAGAVGAASCLFGLNHVRTWGSDSLPAAAAAASIAWSLTILALGFACKHIRLHTKSDRLRTLEGLIIVLSATMLLYMGAIHGAMKR
ncbi:membrane protein PM19L-like [Silene latifolia]|uniref:membrane protein PM19L-like n=1 Tax=Silene latifolia TaxID=37657 RepID=UPI003D77392C